MIVELLTEHHLEFLNLKRGCRGSSESTLILILLFTVSEKQRSAPLLFLDVTKSGFHCIIYSKYG